MKLILLFLGLSIFLSKESLLVIAYAQSSPLQSGASIGVGHEPVEFELVPTEGDLFRASALPSFSLIPSQQAAVNHQGIQLKSIPASKTWMFSATERSARIRIAAPFLSTVTLPKGESLSLVMSTQHASWQLSAVLNTNTSTPQLPIEVRLPTGTVGHMTGGSGLDIHLFEGNLFALNASGFVQLFRRETNQFTLTQWDNSILETSAGLPPNCQTPP